MAKVDIKMPEDFLLQLSGLGKDFDGIAERVLEAGGEIVLEQVKRCLEAVVGSDTKYPSRTTGELAESLGLSPVKIDRSGNHNVKIGFSEPRQDGGSNAKIANIIEYGKHGQPAKPFLKPAKSASRSAAIAAMQRKLEEEMKK